MMGRLTTVLALAAVLGSTTPAVLFLDDDLRVEVASSEADRLAPGRFLHGRTARDAFPEAEAAPMIALMGSVMQTASPVTIRQRLWEFIPHSSSVRPDIDVTIRPVFETEHGHRTTGVVLEARWSRPLILPDGSETPSPRQVLPQGIPGGIPFYEALALSGNAVDAMSFLTIRQAARDAVVEAGRPLIEELRRLRQASSSDQRTLPEYRPPRPV